MRPYLALHEGVGEHQPSVWMVGANRSEKIGDWPVASGANAYIKTAAQNQALWRNKVARFKNSLYTIQSGNVWRYGEDTSNQWVPVYSMKSVARGAPGDGQPKSKCTTGLYYFIRDNHPCLTFFYTTSDTVASSDIRGVVYDGGTDTWTESEKYTGGGLDPLGDANWNELFLGNKVWTGFSYGNSGRGGYIWDPVSSGACNVGDYEGLFGNGGPFQDASATIYKSRGVFVARVNNGSQPIDLLQTYNVGFTRLQAQVQLGGGNANGQKSCIFTLDNDICYYFFPNTAVGQTGPQWEFFSFRASDSNGFACNTGVAINPLRNSNFWNPDLPYEMRSQGTIAMPTDTARAIVLLDRHDLSGPTEPIRANLQFTPSVSVSSNLQCGGGSSWFEWTPTLMSGYFRRMGTAGAGHNLSSQMAAPLDTYGDGIRYFNGNLAYAQVEQTSEGTTKNTSKLHFRIYESSIFPSGTPCEVFFMFANGQQIPLSMCSLQSPNKGSIRNGKFVTGITFGSGELYTVEWNGVADGVTPWDPVTVMPAVSGVF
jgi:hypothetical protein